MSEVTASSAAFNRSMSAGAGGFTMEISVFGDVQLSRKILRFGTNAMQAGLLWESIYEDLLMIEDEQFRSEGQSGSGGWAPLAESTLRTKERVWGPYSKIEEASGDLMRSLTERGGSGQLWINNLTWMVFGTTIPYAHFQQTGTRKMPRRRIIEFTDTERVLLLKKIQAFIVTGEVVAL